MEHAGFITVHSPRFRLKLIGFALLVLACAGSLPAQITLSADFAAPIEGSYALGIMGGYHPYPESFYFVTVAEAYTAPRPLLAGQLQKFLNAGDYVENISEGSAAAVNPFHPDALAYTDVAVFQPSISAVLLSLPNPVDVFPIGGTRVGKITYDSAGSLYYFTPETGFLKYANNSETPLLTFGLSGLGQILTMSYGLSIENDVVFALDSGAGRVVRFDATTGAFLSVFAVTGAREASDIAVSATGRLYLTNGNGGGTIYDAATGATLDTFSSTGVNAYANGGRDSLYLDGPAGKLTLFDAATGLHVFNDPAVVPEPSTYALGIAALLGLAIWRKTRRSVSAQRV